MPANPLSELEEKKCLDTALRLLTRRDHSRAELIGKLKRKGFSEAPIARVIEECRQYSYLDDERYAHQLVRQMLERGYGRRRIHQSMSAKGLDGDLSARVLESHCTDQAQTEQCRQVLRKKLAATRPDGRGKSLESRLYRFLLGRGFPPEIIREVLRDLLEDFGR